MKWILANSVRFDLRCCGNNRVLCTRQRSSFVRLLRSVKAAWQQEEAIKCCSMGLHCGESARHTLPQWLPTVLPQLFPDTWIGWFASLCSCCIHNRGRKCVFLISDHLAVRSITSQRNCYTDIRHPNNRTGVGKMADPTTNYTLREKVNRY